MSEESSVAVAPAEERPNPLKEITQPFIDLINAPRALWGVNLAYMLEGLCYFGVVGYLVKYFAEFVFIGVPGNEDWAHNMASVLTAGIAFSMAFLGFVPDKWGVRRALILSFTLLVGGRAVMAAAPTVFGLAPDGVGSALHLLTMAGILLVVVGYGMYQPAAYAAVRQFTTPKTAAMGYAMLYALMNAGSSLLMLAFLLRDEKFLGLGIPGTFWVFTALTVGSLLVTVLILSRRTVTDAIAAAKAQAGADVAGEKEGAKAQETAAGASAAAQKGTEKVPVTMWISLLIVVVMLAIKIPYPYGVIAAAVVAALPTLVLVLPREWRTAVVHWAAVHPLADAKFFVFIFALIPVQTLFTYNWLVLPEYISRAYQGWIGEYYEIASNANPILIFILVPVVTALTYKRNIYTMMIVGTAVMGSSAFVLSAGPTPWALGAYIVLMTIGEALWQPRFLGYATEIAPEGRAGQYQGVAQLPWFLTKALVPLLYSGKMIERFCPAEGPKDTQTMWFIFGLIAISTPVILLLLKGWLGKQMKTKAA